MPAYRLEGFTPVVDPTAFVHPQAVLIGDVIVGARCYVGPGASLRGDFGRIVVGPGSNVQDGCIMHAFPSKDAVLEEDSHIGHGAVLHGCTIRRGALIGIGAIVMDDVTVEEEAFVGAASFVRAGFVVPRRTLVTGVPARVVRQLSAEELEWKAIGTREYQELTLRCLAGLAECRPLTAVEPDRARLGASAAVPLHTLERK
ncbi:MAG TPA: transferase hexapeptide repeat family protein [Steroidobacteraceae bacterium]|nr:transferase hexapeptide repeat family protein [Candidatus Dormibacteraeota bacterium]HYM26662.1 transferase hexapeptide repeat family protein [Steroidobacteraceae bacterium]